MANERITTLFNFEVKGTDDVVKGFQAIAKALPTKELQFLIGKLGQDFESFFKNIGKGLSLDDLGVDNLLETLSKASNAMRNEFSMKGITVDIGPVTDEIKELEEKVTQGREKVAKLNAELDKERQDMLDKMANDYIKTIDEKFLDGTRAANELTQLNKKKGKAAKDGNKELEEALKEEIGLFEKFIADLQVYLNKRRSLGSQLGGTQKGLGASEVKLEEAKGKKAETEKLKSEDLKGEKKAVKELASAYNFLVDVIKYLHELKADEAHKKTAKAAKEHEKTVSEAARGEKELEEATGKGERTMAKKIITGLSYYTVFNKIKQIIKASVKAIEELDKAMTKASIVTSMTRKEAWQLLKSYQNLAQETGKTTSEIANLNAFFLQQGKTVKQAMEMTEAAAKSAAVAGTSLQDAANYITSAIHGFGLAADEAERVADKFAALGASSASSFEEIAIAMSKVAPVAQSAGVGIDFMMGILAKGIHTTREAPEAIGTAMKTIFARMRELTDIGKATEDGMSLNRVERALNSINVDLRDVTGQFRNLEDVLIDVGMKWKDLDSLEQAYLATALAGTRQQPRLLAILNDFETTMEFIETSKNAEDALMFQHMDYMTGMEAATNSLKNSWEQIVTSIVSSDVIIESFHIIAGVLRSIGDVVGFITDRFWLMIPALSAVAVLTVNLTLLKLSQWRAALKLNKEEGKGFLQSLINHRKEVIERKILEKQTKKNAAAKKAATVATKQETAATTTQAAAGTAEAGASGVQTGANYAKATSIWAVVSSMLVLTAVVAGGIVAIWGLVKLFKEVTKTAKDFSKEIDKNNKLIYDSNKKLKEVADLTNEYNELAKKVAKTNDELERMEHILNDLESYNDGENDWNFIATNLAGERVLNKDKIKEFQKQEEKAQLLAQKKSNKEANKALRRLGSSVMGEDSIRRTFAKSGENIAQGFIDQIDNPKEKQAFAKSISEALEKVKMEDFILSDTQLTTVYNSSTGQAEYIEEQINHRFDRSAYLNAIKDISNNIRSEVSVMEGILDMNTSRAEDLQVQLKLQLDYVTRINQKYGESSVMAESLRATYSEAFRLNEIMVALNYNTEEFAGLVIDMGKRGVSADMFLAFSEKTGLGSQISGFSSLEDYKKAFEKEFKALSKAEEDVLKAQEKLDDLVARGAGKGKINKAKEYLDNMKDIAELAREAIPELNDQQAAFEILFEQYGLNKMTDDMLSGNITDGLAADVIKAAAMVYKEAFDLDDKEAWSRAYSLYSPYLITADQAAAKIKETGNLISESLDIYDQVKKGDFSGYLKLVEEVGIEAADSFLASGDISKIQETIYGNTKAELERTLAILKTNKHMTDLDKARVAELEFMIKNLENITHLQEVWNKELEKSGNFINRLNSYRDFLERLEGFEMTLELGSAFDKGVEHMRDSALNKIGQSAMSAKEASEKAYQELLDNNLITIEEEWIDGTLVMTEKIIDAKTFADKELIDTYYEANDHYMNVSNQALDLLDKEIDRYKKVREKEIKTIEDLHKEEMNLIKKQFDEKWKAIDYENKILELQEKVTLARNKLAAALYGGDVVGEKDARKALKEAREARQKEIEKEILDRIQKQEEMERDKRIEDIQVDIKKYSQETAESFKTFLDKFEGDVLKVEVTNPEETGPAGGSTAAKDLAASVFAEMSILGTI